MRRSIRHQRGFWNFLLPAIASVAGGLIGASGQEDANDTNVQLNAENRAFNAEQADIARVFNAGQADINRQFQSTEVDEQRDWSERMANTSYQRAVGDLRAAGLNPMLAYSQGGAPMPQASAPGGSTASGAAAASTQSAMVQSSAQAGITSAAQAAQISNLQKQGANIDADTELKRQQTDLTTSTSANVRSQTDRIVQGEIPKLREEVKNLGQQQVTAQFTQELLQVQSQLARVDTGLRLGQLDVNKTTIELSKVELLLAQLKIPEARAGAEFYTTQVGQMAPHLRQILEILKAIGRR